MQPHFLLGIDEYVCCRQDLGKHIPWGLASRMVLRQDWFLKLWIHYSTRLKYWSIKQNSSCMFLSSRYIHYIIHCLLNTKIFPQSHALNTLILSEATDFPLQCIFNGPKEVQQGQILEHSWFLNVIDEIICYNMSIDMAVSMGSFKESTLKQCMHLQVWCGGQAIHFFS